MDCEQSLTLITARLDGEIDRGESALLEGHLQECASCRTAADGLRQQDRALRQAFSSRRQAAAAVAERVVTRVRPAPRSTLHRFGWVAMLASAAAGFLLAVVVFRPWQKPEPDPWQTVEVIGGEGRVWKAPGQAPPKPDTAMLAVASQAVEMLAPGTASWQVLKTGGEIAAGARVRTGPMSRCEFRTADGSEIRLNAGTEILFNANRSVEVARGEILARVAEAPSAFRVIIPAATITALGTEFDILCRVENSVLTVLEGATEVQGKESKQFVLTGEVATIIDGRVTHKEPINDLVHATSWTHEILKLKGRDNKELARRVDDILAQIGASKTEFLPENMIRELGDHCVLPLTRFIQSDRSQADPHRRHKAARLLSELAQPWSVPDLIKLLADKDGIVRYHAAQALERLTRETFGCKPEDWRKQPWVELEGSYKKWNAWWQENKDRYPAPP
jgi:ferric-dicitrate binding protein FerR (iron transport regulator)